MVFLEERMTIDNLMCDVSVAYGTLNHFEQGAVGRICRKFDLSGDDRSLIILSLYRFKKILNHYKHLWVAWCMSEKDLPKGFDDGEIDRVFMPISIHIDGQTRKESFSNGQFFGKLHYLLHGCATSGVSREDASLYLRKVCEFPVIIEQSFEYVIKNEIYPANLPHTFLHMACGLIVAELKRGRNKKEILSIYRKFLRERHVSRAHAQWFKTRLSGSFGSRQ